MRFLRLGILLLAAGPSLVNAQTIDGHCFRFELSQSLGHKSPTYVWSKLSSKEHTAKLSPLAPPTDHPSIVTVTRMENQLPSLTPIQIDGFENFQAVYLGGNKKEATVAIRAELENLNATMFPLPAKGEVFNPATFKYESYYVVEEKGHAVFYPNQEAVRFKMRGKSLSQIGKDAEPPDHPRFHLSLSKGEQRVSMNFFKNPNGKEWDLSFTVDESKIRHREPVKVLSAPEFNQKYPHNLNDLSKPQTPFSKEGFLVSGYNAETGMVTVAKEHVKIVDLKIHPDNPSELITSDHITLRRVAPQTSHTPMSRPIQPGDLFLGSDGFTYEVRSYNSHHQAKAFLRRIERREMTLSVFENGVRNGSVFEAPSNISTSISNEIVDTKRGFFKKVKTFLGSLRNPRRRVKLLGTQNITRLAIKDTRFEGYDKSFSGQEITYQIHGPKGDSKLSVRISKDSLTTLDQKRVDALVSQIPTSQADAVRSIELIDRKVDQALRPPNSEYNSLAGLCLPDRTIVIVNFFEEAPESSALTLWHETGHAIAMKVWDSFQPGQEWVRAAVLDGHFISGYSQVDAETELLVEDFAETVAAYIATDGGRSQPGLRQAFKNRFEYLDRALFPR